MVKETSPRKSIDITHLPELIRIVQEVQRTQQPQPLTRDGQEVAMLVPTTTVQVATPLSDEEVSQALAALEQARAFRHALRQRYSTPFPSSVDLINQEREERSKAL